MFGRGPRDLLFLWAPWSNIDLAWEHTPFVSFLQRMAALGRVIQFDRRGTGLSDRAVPLPTLEEQMDDVVAVMEAAGSRRAAVYAQLEGGAMAALFAATHPERTQALVLYEAMPRMSWAPITRGRRPARSESGGWPS